MTSFERAKRISTENPTPESCWWFQLSLKNGYELIRIFKGVCLAMPHDLPFKATNFRDARDQLISLNAELGTRREEMIFLVDSIMPDVTGTIH